MDLLLNFFKKIIVFHRYTGDLYGSWMMDAYFEPDDEKKIWVTNSGNNQTLHEFDDKAMYRINQPSKNYTLPLPFTVILHCKKKY